MSPGALILTLFHPRSHTKVYEDTRRNHFFSFLLFMAKGGALFFDNNLTGIGNFRMLKAPHLISYS